MSIRPEGRRWTAAMLILAGIGLSTLAGCSREDARPAPAATPARDPMHVKADGELLKRLQVAPAARVEIQEYIRVAGSVQVDEDRVARIGWSVTGRITDAPGALGLDVRAGQMLATLDSAELAAAQRNFLKTGLDLELVQRAVERARLLVNADVIASKLSGTVIERRVTVGQVVQPADQLFTIADLSEGWVVSEVPEEQAFGVRVGDPVEVAIPALRDRRLDGKVTFAGNTVNPETRTITVRTVLPSADRSIKPAMLASMAIREPVRRALAVPAAAVVREASRDHVFVQARAGLFHLRPATLGPESNNGLRPVLGGLSEGEPVVVDGAFHLNNERNRQ